MRILITGGTGSFGHAFVKKYYLEHELTVFSRDENKQFEMRQLYPDIRYEVGDVRDRQRIGEVVKSHEAIFHAAALKQVPTCEFFPLEAVKTNILGTDHVLDAARACGVKKVVCLSTDKAVYPINAMGTSKAMMEKIAISKGAIVTRYGNIIGSRGSIVPIWQQAASSGQSLTLTDAAMTRFLMSLNDSIELVMHAMDYGNPGEIFVRRAPASTMLSLARAIGGEGCPIKIIGRRHGEKLHETLISQEEMSRAEPEDGYFRIKPDVRNMNYEEFFTKGEFNETLEAYTSENTTRLNITQVRGLLHGLKEA